VSAPIEAEIFMSEIMTSLDDRNRRLLACWLDGWSWAEIGKELDISGDAARMRWQRLCSDLKKKLVSADPGTEMK
jgi:DNA-directed RNA polymerase specialized sigma24 family protein